MFARLATAPLRRMHDGIGLRDGPAPVAGTPEPAGA